MLPLHLGTDKWQHCGPKDIEKFTWGLLIFDKEDPLTLSTFSLLHTFNSPVMLEDAVNVLQPWNSRHEGAKDRNTDTQKAWALMVKLMNMCQ